jgi:hypothetical protein
MQMAIIVPIKPNQHTTTSLNTGKLLGLNAALGSFLRLASPNNKLTQGTKDRPWHALH